MCIIAIRIEATSPFNILKKHSLPVAWPQTVANPYPPAMKPASAAKHATAVCGQDHVWLLHGILVPKNNTKNIW
jgi:hypothetical protein